MNEEQAFQNLFETIRAEVSASEHLRESIAKHLSARPSRALRLRLLAAGGFTAIAAATAVTGLLLMPSASQAALRRIGAALRLRSMHIRTYVERSGEGRLLSSETFLSHGDWRADTFFGTDLARTSIRSGGWQWLYFACTNVSVGEPMMDNAVDDIPTAVDLVKVRLDDGLTTAYGQYRTEARPAEGGRGVYALVDTRKDTAYHFELIVDKASDLPIRASLVGVNPKSPGYQAIFEEYRYDDFDPNTKFSPRILPTTRILDLPTEAESLKSAWSRPIRSFMVGGRRCELRDVERNVRGEVFMAFSYEAKSGGGPDGEEPPKFPTEMTDDLGREYVLAATPQAGWTFGDTNARDYLRIGGDRVEFLWWAPAAPEAHWRPAREVQMAMMPTDGGSEVIPLPTPISGHVPAYTCPLMMSQLEMQLEMYASEGRANRCRRQKDIRGAAEWYRDAARHAFPHGWSKRLLAEAAVCDQLAGHTAP